MFASLTPWTLSDVATDFKAEDATCEWNPAEDRVFTPSTATSVESSSDAWLARSRPSSPPQSTPAQSKPSTPPATPSSPTPPTPAPAPPSLAAQDLELSPGVASHAVAKTPGSARSDSRPLLEQLGLLDSRPRALSTASPSSASATAVPSPYSAYGSEAMLGRSRVSELIMSPAGAAMPPHVPMPAAGAGAGAPAAAGREAEWDEDALLLRQLNFLDQEDIDEEEIAKQDDPSASCRRPSLSAPLLPAATAPAAATVPVLPAAAEGTVVEASQRRPPSQSLDDGAAGFAPIWAPQAADAAAAAATAAASGAELAAEESEAAPCMGELDFGLHAPEQGMEELDLRCPFNAEHCVGMPEHCMGLPDMGMQDFAFGMQDAASLHEVSETQSELDIAQLLYHGIGTQMPRPSASGAIWATTPLAPQRAPALSCASAVSAGESPASAASVRAAPAAQGPGVVWIALELDEGKAPDEHEPCLVSSPYCAQGFSVNHLLPAGLPAKVDNFDRRLLEAGVPAWGF
eukprot:TRINITY_DN18399_c0_g1_i2.p1 TRINITY_DN18399_c0_g1~~TRINITY_DN18399_c0_g1_i2.p1  ORF type:complete len:517 (-),score=134.28 TRINITY_DN18399_c0_g1_i2:174-1724(-)